jgi:hypothetical protein
MLSMMIEVKAGNALGDLDANLENMIAGFVDGVGQSSPEMTQMKHILSQKLDARRNALPPQHLGAEGLKQRVVDFIETVFPEMRLPQFVLKKLLSGVLSYAEIPLPLLCNDILESAEEANLSLPDLLKKRSEAPAGAHLEPVRSPRELVRRLVGAKKRDMGVEIANEDNIVKRFLLGVKLFLFSIVGFFLPYIIFGQKAANGLEMADRMRAIARSLRRRARSQLRLQI